VIALPFAMVSCGGGDDGGGGGQQPGGGGGAGSTANQLACVIQSSLGQPNGQINAFRSDAGGNLTALTGPGSSFPTGVHAHNLTVSPNNQFIYVASSGSGEVHAFSRDTMTGDLTVAGAAITGLTVPQAVTVSPDSRFLYATVLNAVEVFQIGANGALTRILGASSFPTGNGLHAVTIHPNGQFLYTANLNAATISVFRVDSNTGALTPIQTQATEGDPNYIVVHPNLMTLYTADAVDHRVSRFTINQDGTLSAAGIGVAFPVGSGTNGIGTTKF
jgi:DNA-binding beta-propeller fold protein YncE